MTFNENLEMFYKKTTEAYKAFKEVTQGMDYEGWAEEEYICGVIYNTFCLLHDSIDALKIIKN